MLKLCRWGHPQPSLPALSVLCVALALAVSACNPLASSDNHSSFSSSNFQPGLPSTQYPVPQATSLSTTENTTIQSTLSSTNPNNGTLTYSVTSQPQHGSLTSFSSSTGAFTYTPTSGFTGSDSFTFQVNDTFVTSASATVSLTIASATSTPSPTPTPTSSSTPSYYANSTLTISTSGVLVGSSATLTFTVKDSSGNTLSTFSGPVTLAASGGTSTGTISPTPMTNNGNGTFTTTYTGTSTGNANSTNLGNGAGNGSSQTLTVSYNGLSFSNTATIYVTDTTPTISPYSSPTPYISQGSSVTLSTASSTDPAKTSLSFSSCTYETLGLSASDPNYAAAGTSCTGGTLYSLTTGTSGTLYAAPLTLPSAAATPTLTWNPTSTQRGAYQFTLTSSDGVKNTSTTVTVVVRDSDSSSDSNLLSLLDATFSQDASGVSTPSAPYAAGTSASAWLNIISTGPTAEFGGSCTWEGTGRSSTSTVDPYSISFPGTASNSLSAGAAISGSMTKVALETWIKPAAPSSAGAVIASNSNTGSATAGLTLRQSTTPLATATTTPTSTNRAELAVGQKYYSYQDLILSDGPVGFWRLNETSGTTAADLSAYGNTGTYNGGYTLGQTGAHTAGGDNSTSVLFNGSSGYVQVGGIPTALPTGSSPRSIEVWVKLTSLPPSSGTNPYCAVWYGSKASHEGQGICIYNSSGTYDIDYDGWGDNAIWNYTTSTTAWTYFVVTFDGTNANLYANGTVVGSSQAHSSWNTVLSSQGLNVGLTTWGPYYFPGNIADVAIYNYALSQTQITNHYNTGTALYSVPYPGNAVLADKPVGYWRLNETQGNIAYDSSGYGNNGTYNGTYTLGQTGALTAGGDQSTAPLFDGSSAYVQLSAPTGLPTGTAARTLEAWIKPTALPGSQACWASYGTYSSGEAQAMCLRISGGIQQINYAGDSASASENYTTSTTAWTHVVGAYNGTSTTLYANGTSLGATSVSWNTVSNGLFTIANWNSANPFSGNIAEVALYNYVLSPTQISNHYNSGKGPAWWLCQSQTQLSSSNWNFFSSLWDGTNAKLYTNGQLECSVQPSTTYSSAAYNGYSGAGTNLQVAASPAGSSYWDGFLNLLKAFGTSDGVTNPLPSTLPQTDFAATANRFREQPVENIVSDSSLVLHLDPANAYQGTTPYTAGTCPTTAWFDLSSTANNGTLTGFSSCTNSNGWSGTGTTASPFALTFNGTSDYINLGNTSLYDFGSPPSSFTVEAWAKWTSTNNMRIISNGMYGGVKGFVMDVNATLYGVNCGVGSAVTGADSAYLNGAPSSALNNGNWHHLVCVYNSSAQTLTAFADGTTETVTNGSCGTLTNNVLSTSSSPCNLNANHSVNTEIGTYQTSSTVWFNGSIGPVRIYSRALSASEINQNCNAQKSRFSTATCAAP